MSMNPVSPPNSKRTFGGCCFQKDPKRCTRTFKTPFTMTILRQLTQMFTLKSPFWLISFISFLCFLWSSSVPLLLLNKLSSPQKLSILAAGVQIIVKNGLSDQFWPGRSIEPFPLWLAGLVPFLCIKYSSPAASVGSQLAVESSKSDHFRLLQGYKAISMVFHWKWDNCHPHSIWCPKPIFIA